MPRKLLIALLAAATLLLVSACGEKPRRWRIGVSQCSNDDWRANFNRELRREALFLGNVDIEIRSADDDSRRQIADINYFKNGGFDLLVVAPNVEEDIREAVDSAYKSGMPVVVVDRRLGGDNYTAFVGADNTEVGHICAAALTAAAAGMSGEVSVVELRGLRGSSPDRERHAGFVEGLKACPNARVIASAAADWNTDAAYHATDSLLRILPKVDFIFAHNDRMAHGARMALERTGRQRDTRIIGVDALPDDGAGVDMVMQGRMMASCYYPTAGDVVMQRAMDILQHRRFDRETKLQTYLIDQNNARVAKLQYLQLRELDQRIISLGENLSVEVEKLNKQRWVLFSSITILMLLAALLIVLLWAYRQNVAKNKRLWHSASEILSQKEELERKNEHLVDMSHELEQATHAKLMFFTNVSHDFSTPLTLISTPIDILLAEDKEPLTPRQRKLLGIMRRNADALLRLVGQILDFRKVENGRMPMRYKMIDMAEKMRLWKEQFAPTALSRGIEMSYGESLPPGQDGKMLVSVDEEKVERSVFNLLGNAVKFTPDGGRIAMTLQSYGENGFCISVANSGHVMDEEEMSHIFERFYQASNGVQAGGTGIGLAVVKMFAEMHGGHVSVSSHAGRGTVFSLYLPNGPVDSVMEPPEPLSAEATGLPDTPQATANKPDMPSPEQRAAENNSLPTALVIDDNADLLSFMCDILAGSYRLLTAENGKEGLDMAIKEVPDIVVSDVMMPVMDGLECCQRLKAHPITSHIPVLLLTACSLDEQRIQGFDCGADSYISKPFSQRVLLSRMKNLIDNRRRLLKLDSSPKEKDRFQGLSPADREFMERFYEQLDTLLRSPDLDSDTLAESMCLSRTQLYRKIKAITGSGVSDVVRAARLTKVRDILRTTGKTISETGYSVGFSSPSYFTKCYKEFFGVLPGDDRKPS